MPDILFDKFADPKNLKQAFTFIQSEVKRTTLPLDPFWVPGTKAIETLQDAFFTSLSKLLIDGKYTPDEAYFFHQHKENYGIRRIAMITAVDRIVYQAILNKSILGGQLARNRYKLSTCPSISKKKSLFLEDYKKPYQAYWDIQKNYFEHGKMVYRGEYDASSFYDNISHKILFRMLEEKKIGSDRVNSLLSTLLNSWHHNGKGIPQGPDASSVIANFYLHPVDELFEKDLLNCGYSRYMDDISLLTRTNKQLLRSVEKLTRVLDTLDLNLNSKTRSELIESNDYFQDKGRFALYQNEDASEDCSFSQKVKVCAPHIIKRLLSGEEIERTELSKFKYFLKVDEDHHFYEDILSLYPQLPSLATVIARYIEPLSSKKNVQQQIAKLWNEKHLFRWQKLWLAKIILIQKMKGQGFPRATFREHENWELRSMDILVEMLGDHASLASETLFKLIRNAEHVFELSIYCSLLSKAKGYQKNQITAHLSTNKSLEIQSIVLAQTLDNKSIIAFAQNGNLFYSKQNLPTDNQSIDLTLGSINSILGFPIATYPRKRYVFELRLVGDEIVMFGTLLNGESFPAFQSERSSAYYRVLKTMLCLHEPHAPDKFFLYDQEAIKNRHLSPHGTSEVETVSLMKEKRLLDPLGKCLIDHLLQVGNQKGIRTILFRSAIDEDCFNLLPKQSREEIAKLAIQVLNPVN